MRPDTKWGTTLAEELRDRARAAGCELQRTTHSEWLVIRARCVVIPCRNLVEVRRLIIKIEETR